MDKSTKSYTKMSKEKFLSWLEKEAKGTTVKYSFPLSPFAIDFLENKIKHTDMVFDVYNTLCAKAFDMSNHRNIYDIYSIKENACIGDFSSYNENGQVNHYYPFVFSNNFRHKLLNCPKIKLFQSTTNASPRKKNNPDNQIINYYIGFIYDGRKSKFVLFKENIYIPCVKKNYETGNYSLSAFIQGKKHGYMPLIRFDHNPVMNHRNLFKNNNKQLAICPNGDEVFGSHFHFASQEMNLLAYSKLYSPDAIKIDTSNITFEAMLNIIQCGLVMDKKPLYNSYMKDLSNDTKYFKDLISSNRRFNKELEFSVTNNFFENIKIILDRITDSSKIDKNNVNSTDNYLNTEIVAKSLIKDYTDYSIETVNNARAEYKNSHSLKNN